MVNMSKGQQWDVSCRSSNANIGPKTKTCPIRLQQQKRKLKMKTEQDMQR